MKFESLIKTKSGGFNYSANAQYFAGMETAGKVAAISFINQGSSNSIVRIKYGGITVQLLRGEYLEITQPYGGYDTTTYDLVFIPPPVGAATNNLVLTYTLFVP